MKFPGLLTASAIGAATCMTAAPAMAVTAASGAAAFIAGDIVSAQFRNGLSGDEIYVAPDNDAGNGAPRAAANLAWANTSYTFTFSYDADGGAGGQGLLTASIGSTSAVFGDVASEVVAGGQSFNALSFYINNGNTGAGGSVDQGDFVVSDLVFNGAAVTNGPFGTANAFGEFNITSASLFSDFVVTGTLTRSGPLPGTSQARPLFNLQVGNVQPIPVPLGLPLMATGLLGAFVVFGRKRRAAA